MAKPLVTLFLILALLQFNSKACVHDTLDNKVQSKDLIRPDPSSNRILTAGTANIRISPYYFLDNVSDRIKTAITKQIMPAVIAYYQSALQVQTLNGLIGLDDSDTQKCAGVNSISDLKNGVGTDLVLLVTATADTSSNYIAAATACFNSIYTNWRPYAGHVKFNIVYGFTDDTEFNLKNQIYTTLHEMGHILGFSAGLYSSYVSPGTSNRLGINNVIMQKTVNGVPINILTVDPLKTKLQAYFKCPSLEGAYIEQQGTSASAGSHFERRIFMNELMTASSMIDSKVTEFFLALLEGTGWYTADYTKAEPMSWGKEQTCTFLETKCLDTNLQTAFPTHYCTTLDADSCNFSNEAYGVCGSSLKMRSSSLNSAFNYWGDNTIVTDSFADNCPYYYPYAQTECKDASNSAINLPGGEYFGAESNCFTGTLNSAKTLPFCLKKTCQGSAGSYSILVTVGSTSVTCSSAGPISVPGYSGTLTCPDPETFCKTSGAVYCPRGCMGRGTCNNGVCTCSGSYSGDDCSYDGVMSFSEIKGRYPYVPPAAKKSNKTIIYAIVGAVAGVILIAAAYFVIRAKRIRLRKAAAQKEAVRSDDYSASASAKSNQVAAQNNPDSKAINVEQQEQQQKEDHRVQIPTDS